jgi:microcystin-dependent protein
MVDEYLGAIKLFAGNYAIKNYAFCQGQTMSIQQNTALFALLGTTFGGNGMSTFQLPNLQSMLPIGQGQGHGLTPRVMGEVGGVENVALLPTNVPGHNHVFNASSSPTSTNTAGPTVLLGALQSADGVFYAPAGATGLQPLGLNPLAVGLAGNNLPHNNIQPSMGINYIICLSGIFPSRG